MGRKETEIPADGIPSEVVDHVSRQLCPSCAGVVCPAATVLDFEPSIGHRYAYDGAGNTIPLVVGIPPVGFPTGPTGQVFNSNSSFNLPDASPAHFLFDTLDGRILGWNGARHGGYRCTVAGAVYHGARDRRSGGANYIYAADNTGHITVFGHSLGSL